MPSSHRQKPKSRPPARKAAAPKKAPPKKAPARKTGAPRPSAAGTKSSAKPRAELAAPVPPVRRADGRVHVLSLAFVRDGDEFMARLETDGGQITELKNRSLDQLLTLVASELEDVLE
jgi:hypothetical protein